ncbi:hypothetical protein ACLQ28_24165 [Micromonospora sp. DT201]|uniref:hypothetical protein n=1 Tax=Micromonospora sp. DT201 TaxID=3393442 RepID=UPI003CF5064E
MARGSRGLPAYLSSCGRTAKRTLSTSASALPATSPPRDRSHWAPSTAALRRSPTPAGRDSGDRHLEVRRFCAGSGNRGGRLSGHFDRRGLPTHQRPNLGWYVIRTLSESIKSLTWRFTTAADPFPGSLILQRQLVRGSRVVGSGRFGLGVGVVGAIETRPRRALMGGLIAL